MYCTIISTFTADNEQPQTIFESDTEFNSIDECIDTMTTLLTDLIAHETDEEVLADYTIPLNKLQSGDYTTETITEDGKEYVYIYVDFPSAYA